MSAPSACAGLLLAGGQSRRYGSPKADALLAGRTLAEWSVATLQQAGCAPLAVSGRAASLAGRFKELADPPAATQGPLAGIAAGLAWAGAAGAHWLATLPCDTPFTGPDIISRLIVETGEADVVLAATRDGAQPLCGVWRVALGPALADLLRDEHPAVAAAAARIGRLQRVEFDRAADFANVNTPDDMAAAEREAQARAALRFA